MSFAVNISSSRNSLPRFSYNFSFARAYNSRVREKLKGMVTMKEKDNIRHGDVDDMIFGSEAHVSER